ncbi:MAG TPA: cob(I)yrinic acid a,c-diamide adenosyltransferase [Candidatus Paceibacterota bacterium]|nr:cob(I)yrinic acid a,c-diamide adenosyltransferase [Candidatus Paceibacterota bacterium]
MEYTLYFAEVFGHLNPGRERCAFYNCYQNGINDTMFIVITGNGKGKTTAAIGQAIRAMGAGKRVFMIQFIKSDKYPSGEDCVLNAFEPRIHFEKAGLGFVGILGDKLPLRKHKNAAQCALKHAKDAMLAENYDLIILDEINVAMDLKLISLEEAVAFVESIPEGKDVVFTGRHAHSEILARADLITNCQDVWHPYHENAMTGERAAAKRGIEY